MENEEAKEPEGAKEESTADIPEQIFKKFIEELKTSGTSDSVVNRLENSILTQANISEQSLRSALFGDLQSL